MIFLQYIKQETGLTFVKEHKFHPIRKWMMDYACIEYRICIEVEGGVFTQGRHTRGTGFLKDVDKYNNMTAMGWKLIRVTPDTLCTQQTANFIRQCLSGWSETDLLTNTSTVYAGQKKAKENTKKKARSRKSLRDRSIVHANEISSLPEKVRKSLFRR